MTATSSFNSGPFNIEKENSAEFVIEFIDANGNLTVPSSADLTVTYVNTSNSSQIDSVALSNTNEFFIGTWSSTSSALGLALWEITCAGSTVIQSRGKLRIIQRQSTL